MAEFVTNPCDQCGAPTTVLASQYRRGRGRTCSRKCSSAVAQSVRWAREYAEFKDKFWQWVDKSAGPDACWPWLGKRMKAGYGRYRLRRKTHSAHRHALTVSVGDPPDQGAFAMHSCDNPPCCNPAHLRWGTHQDNMNDRMVRGRYGRPFLRALQAQQETSEDAD